jgi:O-antigen/teichoic acid export membrane protein
MSLRSITKLFAAQNANQLVVMAQQVLLPPAFIAVYGRSGYGQWLALSAAISYLGTFNYGLQTYTNMQMAIHYNRGEVRECQEVQSAGLRILLGALVVIALVLLVIFALPLASWLRLTIPNREAQLTLYLLGMQLMANMLFGFFSGSFLVFNQAHRGQHYGNINQLICTLAIVGLVVAHLPFPVIVGGQLAITLITTTLVALDLGRRCPDLRPRLRYWKKGALGSILKPSSQYMLLASSNLLAYQVPIILMQRLLGPTVVVVYSVSRTVYSMSRRLLYVVTNSLSAEITTVYGRQDWPALTKLYRLSERVILLLTPPVTFGAMLATPLLLKLWLAHGKQAQGNLFHPGICITLGLTVSVLAIKEHKYQFQFSTNKVESIAWQTLAAYGSVCILSYPLMQRFGIQGYLVTWLLSETLQLFYLLHLNDRLFAGESVLDHKPVYLMLGVLAVCTALFFWPMHHLLSISYVLQGALAVATTLVLGVICYKLFEVDELRSMLWAKVAARVPALAGRGGNAGV